MKINLPPHVAFILKSLNSKGHEAFAVGGCVRDSIMGKSPHDWDICTSALPQQTMECFAGFTVLPSGLQHGTVTLILEKIPYEITTYRIDGEYAGHRRPQQVVFTQDIEQDLARRDFTMNAMAYSSGAGLIDPFGGVTSIKNKEIKCVGLAAARFEEDALRVLRALRFASVLGFKIEENTQKAIWDKYSLLREISAERISQEFMQMLIGAYVLPVLLQYKEVIAQFIPEITPMFNMQQHNPHHLYDVWEHTARAIAAAPAQKSVRLAMLFHDMGKPQTFTMGQDGVGHFYKHHRFSAEIAKSCMRRLRFSNALIEEVAELVYYHDATILPQHRYVRRWLNRMGENRLLLLLEVKRADVLGKGTAETSKNLAEINRIEAVVQEVLQSQQCFRLKDMAVNGTDLMSLGLPAGKELGLLLNALLAKVINEELPNDKQALMQYAQKKVEENKK